jgi:hypothetical protein
LLTAVYATRVQAFFKEADVRETVFFKLYPFLVGQVAYNSTLGAGDSMVKTYVLAVEQALMN